MGKQTFGIALSKGAFVAGDKLSGNLYFDSPSTDSKATSVCLEFLGQEETLVKYTYENSTSTEYNTPSARTKDAISSRNLIQVMLPIDQTNLIVNGCIPAGKKYNVPFVVDLPKLLPSTFRENYHDGSYCQVVYVLKAEIKGSGIFSNYKAKQEILIVAPPLSNSPLPYTAPPSVEAVNMLCCINQGTVSVSAKIQDTTLDRGQSTGIVVACRNQSSTTISGIVAELHQECAWEAERRRLVNKSKLATIHFKDLSQILADNQDAGKSLPEILLREVESGKHKVDMTAPEKALPTYTGTLVNVSHHLDIVVQTGACIDNPTLRIPIQIGSAKAESNAPTTSTVPPDFAPDTDVDIPVCSAELGTQVDSVPKTTDGLLKAMESSLQNLNLIQEYTMDSAWKAFFGGLSANEYGRIVKAVSSDFEQPAVAELLAKQVDQFTCQHAVLALQNTSDWSRGNVLEKLLPEIKDLKANQKLIRNELSEWELMVAQNTLDEASLLN